MPDKNGCIALFLWPITPPISGILVSLALFSFIIFNLQLCSYWGPRILALLGTDTVNVLIIIDKKMLSHSPIFFFGVNFHFSPMTPFVEI